MTPRIVPTTSARTVNSGIRVSGRMKGSNLGLGLPGVSMGGDDVRAMVANPPPLATHFRAPRLPDGHAPRGRPSHGRALRDREGPVEFVEIREGPVHPE